MIDDNNFRLLLIAIGLTIALGMFYLIEAIYASRVVIVERPAFIEPARGDLRNGNNDA